MSWSVDHLVVAARTLDEGAAWCEATLGIVPGPGGRHPLMGTHNRLFSIAGDAYPRAYFEIIAIDPDAPPPGRTRWYDLDVPSLQRRVATDGPALIHWVAGCAAIDAEIAALRQHGIERGEVLAAERATPTGLLRWSISVRTDGARLGDGAWPTLIEWPGAHPVDTLAAERRRAGGRSRSTRAGRPACVTGCRRASLRRRPMHRCSPPCRRHAAASR